jgi:glycosyltransferase involved in cell wall biosynthesis
MLSRAERYVDEIVIIDQQSTDVTKAHIMQFFEDYEYTNKRFIYEQDQHWGYCEPSRKMAWQLTQSDWILVLDADERISDEFAQEIRKVDDLYNTRNVKLKRSFYLANEHRFTGDYQHRFFHKKCVEFLDEIHTDPQPKGFYPHEIYSPNYIGIWHIKSWAEQERDELAYEQLILNSDDPHKEQKLALNVHLPILRKLGMTGLEVDMLTRQERKALGI